LLCSEAVAVTLKAEPAALEAGLLTLTLFTLMSDVAPMSVVLLPLALLLPPVGSLTCSWSTAAEALTWNWWLETVEHVTDHVGPVTVVAVDVGSDVSCVVCGLVELVVQSGGRLSVNVVSTFVGPNGPLLCSDADAVTLNAAPAALLAGLVTVTLFTLMSEVAVMFVLLLPLAVLFELVGSITCSWSMAAEAVAEKLWLDGPVQVTSHDTGTAGTVVAVEVGSDVFCTVCGLAEDVVQSAGTLRLNVVSTLVGP